MVSSSSRWAACSSIEGIRVGSSYAGAGTPFIMVGHKVRCRVQVLLAGFAPRLVPLDGLRGALLRFFFHGVAARPPGGGPLMVRLRPAQRLTCLLIHAACLVTNSSRLISPLCTMSRACSQIAVVPGSAMARGTASIRLNAAGVAARALPFLTR
ncbi:hypothetical protein D3C85_1370350 [compost metagenome]